MVRRWAALAVAAALAMAAGCSGGGSGGQGANDPLAEAPAATVPGGASTSTYQPSTVLGTVTNTDIPESSGLVASRRYPGLLWTHNDSGDDPMVYCLSPEGKSCGAWRVTGAEAFDWEDMATGPALADGSPSLYLGDIGDNLEQRTEIVVYRIPEPVATAGPTPTRASPSATPKADVFRYRYPDGAHNAEAMIVHPTSGDLYVITKDAQSAGVYKAKAPLDPAKVTTLAQIGSIRLGSASRGLELVTGADVSPDGTRVALASYAQGYELVVPAGGTFDDIWAERPVPIILGARLQGESVAYRLDGRALLTTSEILPFQIQQVERRGR